MLIKLDHTAALNTQEVRHQLHLGKQLVLIKNFPLDDLYLENFILKLGKPVLEARNIKGKSVFDVEVSKHNDFFKSIANSNLDFPLHTDCSDFNPIPNSIAMLCVEPAHKQQGISHFALLATILDTLSDAEKKELVQKQWTFRNKQRPILLQENNTYTICYDRITIESFSDVSPKDLELLNKLDTLFIASSFSMLLEKGDLILFRNDLMLHGRGGFDIDTQRLLKRVRFQID